MKDYIKIHQKNMPKRQVKWGKHFIFSSKKSMVNHEVKAGGHLETIYIRPVSFQNGKVEVWAADINPLTHPLRLPFTGLLWNDGTSLHLKMIIIFSCSCSLMIQNIKHLSHVSKVSSLSFWLISDNRGSSCSMRSRHHLCQGSLTRLVFHPVAPKMVN